MVLTALLWLYEKKCCSWESVRFHQESPVKLSKQLSSFKVVRPVRKLFYICAHVHSILKRHQRGYLQYSYLGALHETTRFIHPRFSLFGACLLKVVIFLFPLPRSPRVPQGLLDSCSYMLQYFQRHSMALLSFYCQFAWLSYEPGAAFVAFLERTCIMP